MINTAESTVEISRRSFLKTASISLAGVHLSGCTSSKRSPRPQPKPNIVFILSDNHSYYELGCHGNKNIRTPNLDRLCAQSVEFTNWHADAYCSPSRASLLTGRNSMRMGIYHTIAGRYMLGQGETTMADVFRANGYATGIFGKWHLGKTYPFRPQDHGFDQVYVGGTYSIDSDIENSRFDTTFMNNDGMAKSTGYVTDVIFDAAIDFITDNKARPFFCYVPTTVTHKPWACPEEYAKMYEGKVPENLVPLYGEVTNMDDNVGRLLKKLNELRIADNTIVIFMADQGMECNWQEGRSRPGQTTGPQKTGSVDGRHHVPFFLRFPAGFGKARKSNRLVWNPDLFCTLLELTGVDKPGNIDLDGLSLVPLMQDDKTNWPDRAIILQCPRRRFGEKFKNASIKTQRWRLMEGKILTDAQNDPLQLKDVAGRHPDVVERLRKLYEKWWLEVSRGKVAFARPILGSKHAPAGCLTAMEWTDGASIWSVGHLQKLVSGSWSVQVERTGLYEIELWRYPRQTPKAIGAVSAGLTVGDIDLAQRIEPTDVKSVFKVKLKAGPVKLTTTLQTPMGKLFSAYYAYVKGPLKM